MLELVNIGLERVDEKIGQIVATDVDTLQDASQHIINSGGKRIRPRLVFLSYLAAGGSNISQAVSLAAAIELVHTATLVHDDINDHSPTRRGKIAVHAQWGRTFALLTGDYLFTKVYELMAPYGAGFNIIMADACVRLVEGETMQAAAAKSGSIDQDTYKQIISRKTASLFKAGARMGAMLANASSSQIDALGNYGHNLGMAFQIVDDVLDIIGDPQSLGKPVGIDITTGTGAFVVQNGKDVLTHAVSAESDSDPIKEMLIRLRDSGAVDIAMAQAGEIAERARSSISRLPESLAKDELLYLVDIAVDRQH
jgi:octaprenyl-diphosphate synthase